MKIRRSFLWMVVLIGAVNAAANVELKNAVGVADSGEAEEGADEERNVEAITNCPFNYYLPCQCKSKSSSYDVACFGVPADEVQRIFEATPIRDHIRLYLYINYSHLPAHLIGPKRAEEISIYCQNQLILESIDVDAFRSSEHFTTEISIGRCDLTRTNFSFLKNFSVLARIRIFGGPLLTLESMPFLPSLDFMWLFDCPGFHQWHQPSKTPNLQLIRLRDIGATNEGTIDNILNSLVYYNATLKELSLVEVGLKHIPPQIKLFTQLHELAVTGDIIPTLTSGSLALPSRFENIWMNDLSIETVEPGAFQGDFSSTKIDLGANNLISFEELPFRSLLESMVSGGINIYDNPITCDCDLAWLIRDNRHLLSRVRGGHCANRTRFEELDPRAFIDCQSSESLPEQETSAEISLNGTGTLSRLLLVLLTVSQIILAMSS